METKQQRDDFYEEAMRPLPNYQEVIRKEYIKALKQVDERPVLDLDDLSC